MELGVLGANERWRLLRTRNADDFETAVVAFQEVLMCFDNASEFFPLLGKLGQQTYLIVTPVQRCIELA